MICETDGANGAEYDRETSSGIHLTTPIVSSFTPIATTRSQEGMSVAVQSGVFIPDCIQGQAGRNHRILSRAETFEQAIVAVRPTTVHAINGIGIVGT